MQIHEAVGKGLRTITDPISGKTYIVPAGGSGNEPPPPSEGAGEGAGEGTVTEGGEGQGVQSSDSPEGTQASQETPEGQGGSGEAGGQGFLEPYLKDVPEDQRPVVEPVLERYRQEQDAQFNRRFEQLQEETRVPVTLHQALVQDPIQTVDWIADKIQEERGIDLRSELRQRWYQSQEEGTPSNQEGEGQPSATDEEGKPLTAEDVERILQEREQARIQQEKQQQVQQQQLEQQQKTVNNWIDDAAKKFSLPLDDSQGEDPLRELVIMQANQLHESGQAKGQAAVEMAVESVSKRFATVGSNNNDGNGSGQPRVAEGGSPPPAEDFDVSSPKQRKARMEELFSPSSS